MLFRSQKIAEATKDRPDAQQIHTMLLRSMQQAIYTPINSGHFGLAYEAYTHFTSPIRRYPDLLVHRVIKSILEGQKYELPALPTPGEAHAKLSKRLQKNKPGQQGGRAARLPKVRMTAAEQQAWEAAARAVAKATDLGGARISGNLTVTGDFVGRDKRG